MNKSIFDTEQEANDYKFKHNLFNRVAEPISGGKWGLVFPIQSHLHVNDGAPAGMRGQHVKTSNCIEQAPSTTNLVEVRLSALTRVEYMEIVEVPVNITHAELDDLVNARYRQVDGGEFASDPEYWERGTCEAVVTDMPNAAPSMMAFRTALGLHIERVDAAVQAVESPGPTPRLAEEAAAPTAREIYVGGVVLDACKRAVEKGRSLDGLNLDAIALRAVGEYHDLSKADVRHEARAGSGI